MTEKDVQRRLEVIRRNLERLAEIPQASYEEFAGDFRNVDSALHRLQTTIQALIDLSTVLLARLALPVPRTSAEILSLLEQRGELPQGSATRFRPVIGFRNRIVHLYDRVDERIVYRILTEERSDLTELLQLLLDSLDRAQK